MTSTLVAAVSSSNCSRAVLLVKKLNGTSEMMAIARPHMVAIRASPIPPVIFCTASSSPRSEEHTSELQSHHDLVCRLLLEKKKKNIKQKTKEKKNIKKKHTQLNKKQSIKLTTQYAVTTTNKMTNKT